MAKKENKISWKEVFLLHKRAFQELRRYCPGVFLPRTLYAILTALNPYVTIYFSARIINELAGLRRPEELWSWVIAAIISIAVMNLAVAATERWRDAKGGSYHFKKQKIYSDKMYSMDYADVDKQTTQDLYSQVKQNDNWSAWGLHRVIWFTEGLVQSLCGIAGAIVLTVSLFTAAVPENAGRITVLNHPIAVILQLVMIFFVAAVGPALSSKAGSYFSRLGEEATFANRLFSAIGFLSSDNQRASDIRMYNQQKIARFYMSKPTVFGAGGVFAKYAAGPMGLLYAASAALSAVLTGVVYIFVCLKAWAGAFGVGSVTQYVGALTALTQNVSKLLQTAGDMKNNASYLKIAFEFLDIPNAMYQGSLTTEKRNDRKYDVEFRDVSFKYPGSDNWALRHVSMRFQVGRRLAIVGENGSGKTTFIKLLCRLYDPQEGEILLNGIDIRKYNYRQYMDIFAVVFQDFQLLSQPLGANVAGSMDYDRERVRKALVDAGFGDRLDSLPEGLDTQLYKEFGENGVEVSGGEAQKIAIARALYKDAPFIILDEPTAALDPIAEAEIYSKFNDIVGDKTAIYISHRLSSCKFCDEIAVFHEGAVIQQGSHEDLLSDADSKYAQLWNAQAQYYTEKPSA